MIMNSIKKTREFLQSVGLPREEMHTICRLLKNDSLMADSTALKSTEFKGPKGYAGSFGSNGWVWSVSASCNTDSGYYAFDR